MTKHVRNTFITPRDLLHRESSLCDYCQTAIEQVELLLIVTRENYGTSFIPWSRWAASLASLKREMGERSQLLCLTAHTATKGMHAQRMSYRRATMICSSLFGGKNESTTPILPVGVQRDLAWGPALRDPALPSSDSDLARHSWPNGHHETQHQAWVMQGY